MRRLERGALAMTGDDYPPIHSLHPIGDGRSVALSAPDGCVEWFCPGRVDASPLVAPLLDRARGGVFSLAPVGARDPIARQRRDAPVVVHEWPVAHGLVRRTTFMPRGNESDSQEIVMLVEAEASTLLRVMFRPAFDPTRDTLPNADRLELLDGAVVFLESNRRLTRTAPLDETIELDGGEKLVVRLRVSRTNGTPRIVDVGDALASLKATIDESAAWCSRLRYHGEWRREVVASALMLRLLIYAPTGAVAAAATTSLPEDVGGVRNWDYRYAWLRDAGLTASALYSLGCDDEAFQYADWLCDTTSQHGLPLRPFYGVDGSVGHAERVIEELEGYRRSRPVRVGNLAEQQHQLDAYAELVACNVLCDAMGGDSLRRHWPHFRGVLDVLSKVWREPDAGIWEVRERPRHFVHSKAMACVALEGAARLAERLSLPGDVERWWREAQALRSQISARGMAAGGAFLRAFDADDVDASLLLLPLRGYVDATHPTARATVERIQRELAVGPNGSAPLLRRYRIDAGDGLPGADGAFLACSFWLVENLARAGRIAEARDHFARLVELAGPAGALAEEIDPDTGEQLGNTPQAFSHVALINAAVALDHAAVHEQHRRERHA